MLNTQEIELRLSNIECLLKELSNLKVLDQAEINKGDILTIQEASKLLSLSVPTLYTLIHKRKIPYMKREGQRRVYFSRQELIAYIREGRKETKKEIEDNAVNLIKVKGGNEK